MLSQCPSIGENRRASEALSVSATAEFPPLAGTVLHHVLVPQVRLVDQSIVLRWAERTHFQPLPWPASACRRAQQTAAIV